MDSKPKAWTLWRILLSLLPAFILLPLWWVQGAQDPSSSETLKSDYQLNSLTEKERTWLRDHPVIRVVQDPAWPPVEFIDKHGKSSGMTRDYLDLIEKKIGITFQQVRNLSWQESYARLKQWEIDMTTSVTETPERNEFWAFTKPYMKIPMVIAAHINVTYIADMSELAGKKWRLLMAMQLPIGCREIFRIFL
jgi:ABC-type amino acid transport substrate-binding protein